MEIYYFYLAIKNLHCFFPKVRKFHYAHFAHFRHDRKLRIFPGKCYNRHIFSALNHCHSRALLRQLTLNIKAVIDFDVLELNSRTLSFGTH